MAWGVHLLPIGQSFAHSLFAAGFVIAVVAVYAARRNRLPVGVAFGIGYLSYLVGDSYRALLAGELWEITFLL